MTRHSDIKVLIIDDHALVRFGIRHVLDNAQGIRVVGEANDGQEAIELVRALEPDVILMDIKMPHMDGLEATRRLLRFNPKPNIIIISAYDDNLIVSRLLSQGVQGYITKDASEEEMLNAIRLVASGERFICSSLAQKLALNRYDEHFSPFDELTSREVQIAKMFVNRSSAQEIAETLHISPKTVNTYRYRLYKKLNVKNDIDLVYLAIQHKFIDQQFEFGINDTQID